MLNPIFINEPSPARPRGRHMAAGLLISMISHWLVLDEFLEWVEDPPRTEQRVRLSIVRAAPVNQEALSQAETPAPVIEPAEAQSPQPQPQPQPQPESTDAREVFSQTETIEPPTAPTMKTDNAPLLTRDAFEGIAAHVIREQGPALNTPNGGIVVNPDLGTALAASAATPRSRASTGASETAAQFEGGQWSSHVAMNGRCFRVVAADPLTPGSTEMWYRTECAD